MAPNSPLAVEELSFQVNGTRIPLIYDFGTGDDIRREDLFRLGKRVAA